MLKFKYKAQSHDGEKVIQQVSAEDLSQARIKLEALGYREISFVDDEFTASMNSRTEAELGERLRNDDAFSPEDEVAASEMDFMGSILLLIRYNLFAFVPLILWSFYAYYTGQGSNEVWDWVAYACMGAYIVYALILGAPLLCFERIMQAKTWAQWRQLRFWAALALCLPLIRAFSAAYAEIQLALATADAKNGNLLKGLDRVEPLLTYDKLPEAAYYLRVSEIYDAGNDYENALRFCAKGYELGTKTNTERLSLAHLQAKYGNDIAATQALMDECSEYEVTELAESYVSMIHCLLSLKLGSHEAAQKHIDLAIQQAARFNNPLIEGHIYELKACKVWSLAAGNDFSQACSLYSEIKSFFVAHNDEYVLRRTEQSLVES